MKELIFGIFAEDDANKIFIRNTIPLLVQYFQFEDKIELKENIDFSTFIVAKSSYYVQSECVNVVAHGMKTYRLNVCFVGLDADDNAHLSLFDEMYKELKNNSLEGNALIYIPVQAIEYWLWYIKAKKENSTLVDTTIIDSTKKRKEMKKEVYNHIKPRNAHSTPIVEKLSKNYDIDWLIKHSKSFEHFVNHFNDFFTTLLTTSDEEE